MVVLNTNYASLVAQRSLNTNTHNLNKSIERLSTGLRINSAGDDPAGLEIASRFTTQIKGLNQASANANIGVNVVSTAESALGQSADLLDQIRVLAVQATNGSNSTLDREALQAEVNQLKNQFDAIATQTSFNGIQLLNGAYSGQVFQIGAFAGQFITLNVNSARATVLGNNALTTSANFSNNGLGSVAVGSSIGAFTVQNTVSAQTLTINGAASGSVAVAANATALAIATSINLNTPQTGVIATAVNAVTLSAVANVGTLRFELSSSGFTTQNVSASITNTGDLTALRDAVNASSGTTGVTAVLSTSSTASLILSSVDGGNINFGNFSNTGNAVNSFLSLQGLGNGPAAFMSSAGANNDSATITGIVVLSSSIAYSASSNAANNAGGVLSGAAGVVTSSTLNNVSTIDVSTVAGAQAAITTVDQALQGINSQRASLGANQLRFEESSANSENTAIQITQSRSTIQDVDFATETANFTKTQILSQAANAMLSQANSAPQSILQLLQNL